MTENILYKGFITLIKRRFKGRDWEVIQSKPAVAAVIMNEGLDQMLLVKQTRVAIQQEIWEIPAGMQDVDGEKPCDCIVRELKEEADIEIDPCSLHKIIGYYPLAGCSDAFIEIYGGTATKQAYISKIIYDEDVTESRWFDLKDISKMIEDGRIVDGKTILAYLKVSSSLLFDN